MQITAKLKKLTAHLPKFLKFLKILKNISKLCFRKSKACLRYKELILAFWFMAIMYIFWYKKYSFLLPNSTISQFINYVQILLIPCSITWVAMFLYRPCYLINRFTVILSSLASISAGIYGIRQYIYYYYHHWPIGIYKDNPINTFKQIDQFVNNLNSWVFLLDAMVSAIGVFIAVKYIMAHKKSLKRSINYGSAKFLDLKGIKKLNSKEGLPIGAIPEITDFNDLQRVINSIKKSGGHKLIKIKAHHTTLIAPSRAGKGAGIIIPALLDYQGSVFVTDIKGENYLVTVDARRKRNRRVCAFDPFNVTASDGINLNPLDFLINTQQMITNSQIFAELLCPVNFKDSAEAKHFQEQAGVILQCLCLYVACEPKIKNKTLIQVHDLLCGQQPIKDLFTKIAENQKLGGGVVAGLANRILGIHPRELSGILTTAYSCIKFVNVPEILKVTSSSSIPLTDITKGDLDLFICIPPKHLPTQQRLLRLITGIVLTHIQDAQGNIGKHNILMLLDEMPALGYMKQIEQILSFGAGYGVNLLAVSQTIGFLKNIYPDTWDSFFSNQLSIFFGCNDPMTAEFIVKKIGKTTIEISTISESTAKQQRSNTTLGSASLQSGDSRSETGRDILMPDEIQRLGNDIVIAFNAGEKPILCGRINYWERKEWANTWSVNPFHENRKTEQPQYTVKEYIEMAWQELKVWVKKQILSICQE